MTTKQLLSLTPKAALHVKKLVEQSSNPVEGIRISVKKTGCAGMSYDFSYVQTDSTHLNKDIRVEDKGVTIFVDPFASVFLAGTVIDYQRGKLSSGFVFENPNAKQNCGCGESFTI